MATKVVAIIIQIYDKDRLSGIFYLTFWIINAFFYLTFWIINDKNINWYINHIFGPNIIIFIIAWFFFLGCWSLLSSFSRKGPQIPNVGKKLPRPIILQSTTIDRALQNQIYWDPKCCNIFTKIEPLNYPVVF